MFGDCFYLFALGYCVCVVCVVFVLSEFVLPPFDCGLLVLKFGVV